MSRRTNTRIERRGFTLVELAAVVAVVGTAGAVAGVMNAAEPPKDGREEGAGSMVSALVKARASARQLKDATQVRGIMQSCVIWAQNNQGRYPLPSKIDVENKTVKAEGRAKDTTANILSVLIFNGNISAELCVSPAEVNRKIKVDERYEFVNPKGAVTPTEALWDPGFRCDFLRQPGGNVSYGHMQPSDSRLGMWSDTFSATEALLGNRGPAMSGVEIEEIAGAPPRVRATLRKDPSKTFKIHGPERTWEGNIAYNDGHVNFETQYAPEGVTYRVTKKDAEGKETVKSRPDVLFHDEKDADGGVNAYLGIWRKAGAKAEEFGGIWD